MATRCNICVRLRREDIGKSLRIDLEKIESNSGAVNSYFNEVTLDGEYIEIYVHWDGYPTGVGKELVSNYNTYEKALNLTLGGDCSSVYSEWIPYVINNQDWDQNKPRILSELPDAENDYLYVFDLDCWWVKSWSGLEFINLREYLNSLNMNEQ